VDLDPHAAYMSNVCSGTQESLFLTNTVQQNISVIFFFNILHYDSHESFMLLHQLFFYSYFSCCDLIFLRGKKMHK